MTSIPSSSPATAISLWELDSEKKPKDPAVLEKALKILKENPNSPGADRAFALLQQTDLSNSSDVALKIYDTLRKTRGNLFPKTNDEVVVTVTAGDFTRQIPKNSLILLSPKFRAEFGGKFSEAQNNQMTLDTESLDNEQIVNLLDYLVAPEKVSNLSLQV